MQVDAASLRDLYSGYNVSFNKGLQNTVTHWEKAAMRTPSSGAEENYSWLGEIPAVREWLGERLIHRLTAHRYVVPNKNFELTFAVKRNKIADDQYGIYGITFQNMGRETASHPDDMVFSLMAQGFATPCYDEQYFFDTDHPGFDETGAPISVSNLQAGSGLPWFLLDCSQVLKPMLYQEREGFKFEAMTDPENPHVFMQDEFVYGVRGRSNAGFGFWQLAFGSKLTLNATNFAAARAAMMNFRKRSGKPIGIMPTHLFVPPSLDTAARELLKSIEASGGSNIWAGSVEPVCTAFLGM